MITVFAPSPRTSSPRRNGRSRARRWPATAFQRRRAARGANQALAARRAGRTVHMAGAVGHDGFSDEALALLKEAAPISVRQACDRSRREPRSSSWAAMAKTRSPSCRARNGTVTPQDADQSSAR